MWLTNGVIGDAGGAAGGAAGTGLSELGITNTGLPFCINSASTPSAYYQTCWGANANGQYEMTFNPIGGAAPQGLIFNINGTNYGFPASNTGGGNIVGPGSSAVNEVASFNNTTGTLLRQGPAMISDSQTSAINAEGATFLSRTQSGFTAQQIANWIFCNACNVGVSYDAIRGIGILNPGSTIDLVNGVAGYVMARQAISGPFPTSVALFGMGIADVNNASVWGINTALSDNRGLSASGGTGRGLYNEFDLNVTSTATTGAAVLMGGGSVAQGTVSGAVCSWQDAGNHGTVAKWQNCLFSNDGAAITGLYLGKTAYTGANLMSQTITMAVSNSGGTQKSVSMAAQPTQSILFANTDATPVVLFGADLSTPPSTTRSIGVELSIYGTISTANQPSQALNLDFTDASSVSQSLAFVATPAGSIATLSLIASNSIPANFLTTGGVSFGAAVGATVKTGEIASAKVTAAASAPGAGFGKVAWVADTGGACKLVAYAGTSATPTTIVSGVGAGC